MDYSFLYEMVLILIPLYIANSTAMFLGGKTRLDFSLNFPDNKPLLGEGKTIKGTFLGMLAGMLAVYLINYYFQGKVPIIENYFEYGILLAVGAILGDLIGSFIKRRMDIERGKPVLLLDQLDFVIFGVFLGSLIYSISAELFIVICVVTLIAHKLSNWIAFKIKLKKVPW
ncbi:CDP-2,3-bis-(O-geranylgeranyl)-sn-glycerol synthase [Candidatus Micrarchaeota archaeon]|nr:CDP-2,3-bis-(O-geranylgeranyl)-sn-glycerol synthase [Candidatus Micrarchaeota archaeon]